jgi:hypothetical protein
MGMIEWSQVFAAASGNKWTYGFGDLWGGKFSVEIGQSLSGYLVAGRQTHILGQELKYVLDPEAFYTPASTLGMATMALLMGATGKSELYYGRNMGTTYIGPKFDIKRTPASFEKRVATHKGVGFFSSTATDPVDKAACVACSLMSLIAMGVSIGLDIGAKIAYGDGKNPKASFAVLNTLALALTSRLMALIELIEIKCGWVNMGEKLVAGCKIFLKILGALLLTAIAIPAAAVELLSGGLVKTEDAFMAACNALDNW